jgi:DNA-binding transcriptional MerR regulator
MAEYGVKAVAAYSGINAHTLRIWERRYKAVVPCRSPNGRRIYSQLDAERLCIIAELTTRGHAISAIAKLSLEALEKMLAEFRGGRGPAVQQGASAQIDGQIGNVNAMLLERMAQALEAYQLRELSAQLALARLNCSVSEFVYQIVLPLIGLIGMKVNEEKLSIAHEHALSAILKTHIYQAIYHLGSTRGEKSKAVPTASGDVPNAQLIITTQEGDHHEFGILLASLLAEAQGVSTLFFGCNMPARSLAGAANALRSPVILIGRTIKMPITGANGAVITQKEYLKELDESLVASTEIWLGGVLEQNALKFRARHKFVHISTLAELSERLRSLVSV